MAWIGIQASSDELLGNLPGIPVMPQLFYLVTAFDSLFLVLFTDLSMIYVWQSGAAFRLADGRDIFHLDSDYQLDYGRCVLIQNVH